MRYAKLTAIALMALVCFSMTAFYGYKAVHDDSVYWGMAVILGAQCSAVSSRCFMDELTEGNHSK